MNRGVWLALVLPVLAAAEVAQAKLDIGNPAPNLTVSEWIKGKPVDLAQVKGKQIVVVEFWATWCGPCVQGIPHLTKLQRELGPQGVTVVGMTEHDPANTLDMVKEFVKQQGDRLGYTIAFEQGGATSKSYMEAADETGIPTAFVIDKQGVIAWIGHPSFGMDEVLARLLAGTYDLKLAQETRNLERQMWEATYAGETDKALGFADKLIEVQPKLASPWELKILLHLDEKEDTERALQIARQAVERLHDSAKALASVADTLLGTEHRPGFAELAEQASKRAVELEPNALDARLAYFGALHALERFEEAKNWIQATIKLAPEGAEGLARTAELLVSDVHVERYGDQAYAAARAAFSAEPGEARYHWLYFQIAVATNKNRDLVMNLAAQALNKAADNPTLLNEIAWVLLTDELYAGKFNEVALAAAERCHTVSHGKSWMYLDTLALAKFETGAVDEAIAVQKQAIELCPDESPRAELQATLERYQQAKG